MKWQLLAQLFARSRCVCIGRVGLLLAIGMVATGWRAAQAAAPPLDTITPLEPNDGATTPTSVGFQLPPPEPGTFYEVHLWKRDSPQWKQLIQLQQGVAVANPLRLDPATPYLWQVELHGPAPARLLLAQSPALAFTTTSSITPIQPLPAVVVKETHTTFAWHPLDRPDAGKLSYTVFYREQPVGAAVPPIGMKPDPNMTALQMTAPFKPQKESDILPVPTGAKPPPGPPARIAVANLEEGKTYEWYVVASLDGKPVGESDLITFSVQSSLADWLYRRGDAVQRSYSIITTPDQTQPATFAFNGKSGTRTNYNAEFALIWNQAGQFKKHARGGVIEGNFNSTGADRAKDAFRLRLTETTYEKSRWTSLAAKYETDGNYHSKKLLAEYLYSPISTRIGSYHPESPMPYGERDLDHEAGLQLLWRPYLGTDVGRNLVVGTSKETKGTVLRLVGQLHGEARINTLRRALHSLHVEDVILSADSTYRYLPLEKQRSHNYFTSSLNFSFTDTLSLNVKYSIGKDAPNFLQTKTWGAGLGVKF